VTPGKRRLAAIVAADVAAYSRLVSEDEEGTLTGLRRHRDELIDPLIESHDGRIANTAGDSLLIEFASAVEAVRFALAMQEGMTERNQGVPDNRQIRFRIGINVGDVLERDGDLLGEGVNVAARLEGLAEANGICVSLATRDQVRDRLPVQLDDQGEVQVKNIPRPVHVFRLRPQGAEAPAEAAPPPTARRRGRLLAVAAGLALLLFSAGAAVLLLRPQTADQVAGGGPPATPVPAPAAAPASVPAQVAALTPVVAPLQPAAPEAPPAAVTAGGKIAAAAAAPVFEIKPLPEPEPDPPEAATVAAATPAASQPATPVAAAAPAAATDRRFDGLWTGAAACDTGGGFYTRNFDFQIAVADGRADLVMTVRAVRNSGQNTHRWAAAIDAAGRADATTTVINGRPLPVTVDLSAAPAAGSIAFDGCTIALTRSAEEPTVTASAAPARDAVNGANSNGASRYDGRWSAYFPECGTSFGGAPLFYSIALQVREGVFLVELDVADTYEKLRTTLSGAVGDNGRFVARFETAMKTSETQTLRADLSGEESPPWAAIDDCRGRLKPMS